MDSSPISLYLDLEDGHNASLVVIAKASLAFANAVEELAFIMEPGINVTIEFVSGTQVA
jgi:hypothetical protein